MSTGLEDIFYTAKGKLAALPLSDGGCQFLFCSSNGSDKPETRVYIDTIRFLANYLPAAKEAVRAYNESKEKVSSFTGIGRVSELPKGGDSDAAQDEERIVLYRRLLGEYTNKGMKMKTELVASVYDEKGYIFLKRYWYLQEPDAESRWLPCKGGFQFGLNDNAHDMLEFAQNCEKRYPRKRVARSIGEELAAAKANEDKGTFEDGRRLRNKRQKLE